MALMKTSPSSVGGAVIDSQFVQNLTEEVRPLSLFLNLARVLPARNTTSFTLPPRITSGPTLQWLSEGERKAVSDIRFERETITMRKVAVIVPWTEEVEMDAFLDLPGTVRAAIVRAAAEEIDTRLWIGEPGTDGANQPDGLINQFDRDGTSRFIAGTFTGSATLDDDIALMVKQIGMRNFTPNGIVMPFNVLHVLQRMEDLEGQPKYPSLSVPGAPSLWGIPVRVSNSPGLVQGGPGSTDNTWPSTVIVGAWGEVEVYVGPSSMKITDSATIVDGGTDVHLWQEDKTAIRFVQHVSDVRVRRDFSVAVMKNVEV